MPSLFLRFALCLFANVNGIISEAMWDAIIVPTPIVVIICPVVALVSSSVWPRIFPAMQSIPPNN